MKWVSKQKGFTIVELLIVIVVIGILAAITIISFNGVKNRAVTAQVQSAIEQANKKVLAYAALNSDAYPATLSDAGVSNTDTVSYQYTSDNTTTPRSFAITASNGPAGATTYYVTNASSNPVAGIAPGHNLVVWDKTDDATAPFTNPDSIDTTVFHASSKSVRLNSGSNSKGFRGSPFTGTAGQSLTVSLWIKTDANWDGKSNNSKIRIGSTDGANTVLKACAYNGPKTSWTQVTCTYVLPAGFTTVTVAVGNDGTTGPIWIDDVSISIQ